MNRRTELILNLAKRKTVLHDSGEGSAKKKAWEVIKHDAQQASAEESGASMSYTLDWLNKLPPSKTTENSDSKKMPVSSEPAFQECLLNNAVLSNINSEMEDLQHVLVPDEPDLLPAMTATTAVHVPIIPDGVHLDESNDLIELMNVQSHNLTGAVETDVTGVAKINEMGFTEVIETGVAKINETEVTDIETEIIKVGVSKSHETDVTSNSLNDTEVRGSPVPSVSDTLNEPRDPYHESDDENADPTYNPTVEAESENPFPKHFNQLPILEAKKPRKVNKRVLAKTMKNLGKEYVTKNKKVEAKKAVQPSCHNCKFKCGEKIDESQRQSLFDTFWAVGDLQRQRQFIKDSMTTVTAKIERVCVKRQFDRAKNQAYYMTIDGVKYRVCKKFFLNTYNLTSRFIRTVVEKTDKETGVLDIDRRGKHDKHKKLENDVLEMVRDHIQAIPKVPSHYCRKNTSRLYIEGGKTVADLHRGYQKKCEEEGKQSVDYKQYHKIFKTYNLSFFVPKKDACEECVAYENSSPSEKEDRKESYERHIIEKDLARLEKDKDKNESPDSTVIAVYDLQAVLPCPQGTASSFYYVSKVAVYNLTITDIKESKTTCFVWHEGEGKRGVVEIATCVYKYLEALNETVEEPKDVIFYTDNCAGQQKNKYMKNMYKYAVEKFGNIASITHKFLVRGHTQNEGDVAHSLIEREVKKAKKSGPVYVPEQYYTVIKMAKKKGHRFEVHELCHNDFLDWKALAIPNDDLKINDCCAFKLKKNDTLTYVKMSFEYEWETVKSKSKRVKNSHGKMKDPPSAYVTKLTISDQKKKPLLALLQKKLIPGAYANFYNNL